MDVESPLFFYAALTGFPLFAIGFVFREYLPIQRSFGALYDSTAPILRGVLVRYLLMCVLIVGILLALSGPYKVGSEGTAETATFDVVLLVDSSISMTKRLERAKALARGVVRKFPQANVAACGFTQGSFCRAPLGSSLDNILRTIDTLEIDAITGSGSNIVQALNSMAREFNLQSEEGRLLVLFSDGGDQTSPYYQRELRGVLENLSDHRIHVVTVGMGDSTPIPVARVPKRPVPGKEQEYTTVFSALNEENMKLIAEATNGVYMHETTLEEQDFSFPTPLLRETGALRPTTTSLVWLPALVAFASLMFLQYFFGKNP